MGELLVRMVVSLAVVVGLLILLSRVAARRFQGRTGSTIEVLHRQQLGKSASVSIVSVAGRVLVLGTTEQQVNVLTELDADALESTDEADGADGADGSEESGASWDEEWDSEVEQLDRTAAPAPALAAARHLDTAHHDTAQLPSWEALLAEPDLVTLEELLGRPAPTHAAPAPAGTAPAALAALQEEDPFLPEDPSYAAFASQLRAQLASGQLTAPDTTTAPTADPTPSSGRHAAPVPALELPPVVSGGARAARAATPVAPVAQAPAPVAAPVPAPAVAPAPAASAPAAGTAAMAADIAALRAALLAAQLQASAPAPAVAPGRPSRAERRAAHTAAQTRDAVAADLQAQGALAGSLLSPTTWKQAFRAVNRRAS
jgi:flagellar biogenesis protein FliO